MITFLRPVAFSLAVLTFALPARLRAGGADYQPELFKGLKLVYSDSFDSGKLNADFWEVRQSSTWSIKDGVLTGGPSSKEFQEKKLASADPSHAGLKPVIWLKQVPENFVCTMRLRYSAKAYQKGYPLLDLGHHIHTLIFDAKKTTLTIKKNVESIPVEEQFLPLNQWVDVTIELKKGTILLKVDGKKHVFQSAKIDGAGQRQIDFKGVDSGSCEIDDVKLGGRAGCGARGAGRVPRRRLGRRTRARSRR